MALRTGFHRIGLPLVNLADFAVFRCIQFFHKNLTDFDFSIANLAVFRYIRFFHKNLADLDFSPQILRDLRHIARENTKQTKKKLHKEYDSTPQKHYLQEGVQVILKNFRNDHEAFSNKYYGPYELVKLEWPSAYILKDDDFKKYHVKHLKYYHNQSATLIKTLSITIIFCLFATVAGELKINYIFYKTLGQAKVRLGTWTVLTLFDLNKYNETLNFLEKQLSFTLGVHGFRS